MTMSAMDSVQHWTSHGSQSSPKQHDCMDQKIKAIDDARPLISDDLRHEMDIILQIALVTATCLFGILSNILNIIVYWKQGLKDSITVGLFALSVSDFFVVLFPLFNTVCFILDYLHPDSPIDFKIVSSAAALQTRFMFYSISSSLTVLLSVERCLCVIRPLDVKLIFTRKRTIIMTLFAFIFHITGWIPKYYAQQLRWKETESLNVTSYVFTMWYHPYFDSIEAYHNIVMTIFMPTAAQVVITITAIIMTNGLRKASKFRESAAKGRQDDNGALEYDSNIDSNAKAIGPNNRDARLVKTMVILVTLLSMANIPYIGLEYSQLFVPEIRPGKKYENLFWLLLGINVFLGSINASVNSIVYYSIGSRYRKIVNDTFCSTKPRIK